MLGETANEPLWDEMQERTMRMALGMPADNRSRLLEMREIPQSLFVAFCDAEGVELDDDPVAQMRKQPFEQRMEMEIGSLRGFVAARVRGGLDNLTQVEEWNALSDLQNMPDERIRCKSGVGDLALEALAAICALLNLSRDASSGAISEKK